MLAASLSRGCRPPHGVGSGGSSARRACRPAAQAVGVVRAAAKPGADEDEQESLRGLPGIGRLLYGAASRLERGTSTCLQCKGSGTVDCKDCGGSGLTTSPRAAGTGLLRKVLGKLKSVVGKGVPGGSAMGDAAFILSNRCRRCHGLGRMTCGACGGLGVRATLRRPGDARP